MRRRTFAIALTLAFTLIICACSHPAQKTAESTAHEESQSKADAEPPPYGQLDCRQPYRAKLDSPFNTIVELNLSKEPNAPKPLDIKEPIDIEMKSDDTIKFDPPRFRLKPNERQIVKTTVKASRTGLAEILGVPGNDTRWLVCDQLVDVGFTGHLSVKPMTFGYGHPSPLDIQLVDKDDDPVSTISPLKMRLMSGDASLMRKRGDDKAKREDEKMTSCSADLSQTNAPDSSAAQGNSGDTEACGPNSPIEFDMKPGATHSEQILVTSERWMGGPIHILATLSAGDAVVAQDSFSFDADPWDWLPILLAIGGALLFTALNLAQSSREHLTWRMAGIKTAAGVVTGVIAWLFADLDLLGIKLDRHVPRTYAILGFLFAFIGIDVVLGRRFRKGQNRTTDPKNPNAFDPKDPNASHPKNLQTPNPQNAQPTS